MKPARSTSSTAPLPFSFRTLLQVPSLEALGNSGALSAVRAPRWSLIRVALEGALGPVGNVAEVVMQCSCVQLWPWGIDFTCDQTHLNSQWARSPTDSQF